MKSSIHWVLLTACMVIPETVDAKVIKSVTNTVHENSTYLIEMPIKLDNAGATAIPFTLGARQSIIISFSAECKVGIAGAEAQATIKIDGVPVAPTANPDHTIFCNEVNYAMHTITVAKSVAAGKHRIQVWIDSNAAHYAYFRHSSLVIFN